MFRRRPAFALSLACVAALVFTACQERPHRPVDTPGLPPGAVNAFQRHVAAISGGRLNCSAVQIEAVPRVTGRINDDDIDDFALETRALGCDMRGRDASAAWFCSASACAFPALISTPRGWQVVTLMSGNAIAVRQHYREHRFEVRQVSGEAVQVREYAWRDGALVAVRHRIEAGAAP